MDEGDTNIAPISVTRCREVLGADADDLSDAEIEQIGRYAETLAHVVISMFVAQRIAEIERKQKVVREKLNRLDEAFLYERSIDIETYDRHADKLRQELTLAQIERHSSELEEMDVEGILGFAERILPSASNLWVQSSVAQKQRLQQVFFPDGVRFDGKRLVGTGTTLPVFNYLSPISDEKKEVVDLTGIEPVTS